MPQATARKSPSGAAIFAVGVGWTVIYIVCLVLLKETDIPRGLGIVLAFVPIAPFLAFLWALGRTETDELHQRVQLEALGFAYPAMMVVLMTLGLLELVVPLKPEDFSLRHIWAYMPMLYFLGLALAWRRYK